jgi:hypothetical protein
VGPLENQGFMKLKLLKPFFLEKNLQKIGEYDREKLFSIKP